MPRLPSNGNRARAFLVVLMMAVVVVQPVAGTYAAFDSSTATAASADFGFVTTTTSSSTLVVNQSDPAAFDTIQNAVDNASEGATIVVHSGVYTETVEVDRGVAIVSRAVNESGTLTGIGAPTDAPVLEGENTRSAAFNIHENVTGVHIEGLRISNYTIGIRAWNQGTADVTVRQTTIHAVNNTGVLVGGDPSTGGVGTGPHVGWTIERNRVTDPGNSGFELHNLVDAMVRTNMIDRGSAVNGSHSFSFGFGVVANNESVDNVTFRNNTVTGTYANVGIYAQAGAGFSGASGSLTNVTIVDNHVEGQLPGDGIFVAATEQSLASRIEVRNNTVKNATTDWPGIGIAVFDSSHVDTVAVRNNTLTGNLHGFGIATPTNGTYANVTVVDNKITWNQQHGVILAPGTAGAGVAVHENRIVDNQDSGLRHEGTGQVNATRNYWGAADGPSGVFNGSGDAVVGNVTVVPFYGDADRTALNSNLTRTGLVVNQSDASAYQSIQAAVDDATHGGTVVVHPGVYNETVHVYKPITIVGDTGGPGPGAASGGPVLDSNGSRFAGFALADNVTDVRIDGFRIREYDWGVWGWNDGSANIEIRHNSIREVHIGVLVGSPDSRHADWLVESNRVVNASLDGIEFFRTNLTDSMIRHNEIQRGANLSNEPFSVGLSVGGTAENVSILNNRISGTYDNNVSGGITVRAGLLPGLGISTGEHGVISEMTIAGNHLSGNISGSGIHLTTGVRSPATDIEIVNNTVRNATTGLPAIDIVSKHDGLIESLTLRNNTLTGNEYGVGVGFGWDFGVPNGSYSDISLVENRITRNRNGVFVSPNGSGDALAVHRNHIAGNQEAGLRHEGTGRVNATRNYWGAHDGPSGRFNGSGDAVSCGVAVNPFYADAELTTTASNVTTDVEVNQSDANAFDSIENAIESTCNGSTVEVHPGVYNQTVRVDKPVAVVGDPGDASPGAAADAPVLDGGGKRHIAFVIQEGVTDTRIEGFRVRNYSWGVQSWRTNTTNVTVRQNTIRKVTEGLLAGGPNSQHADWLVESNRVVNASFGGIGFYRMNLTDTAIRNNEVQRGANLSDELFAVGLYVVGTAENVTISNNRINGTFDNARSGGITVRPGLLPGTGVPGGEYGVISGMTIAGNHLTGNISGDGIQLSTGVRSPATEIEIVNNTVRNATTGLPAIDIVSMHDGLISSVTVRNNSLTGNQYGVGFGFGWELGVPNGSYSDIRVLENRITRNHDGVIVSPNGSGDALGVHRNHIVGNQDSGLRHNGTGSVNATHNFWGASNGPSGDFGGCGDAAFGNVTVSPFYVDADRTALAVAPPAVVGDARPTDPDCDTLYEDVNGNGRLDFDDIVTYFNRIDTPAISDSVVAYDFNGNGRVDFDDIVTLFEEI